MAQLLSDGPLGLEARHRFLPTLGSDTLLMHDLHEGVPRLHFDEMPNFGSLPEIADNRSERTTRRGEDIYEFLERGKTFTVNGRLIATSAQEVRATDQAAKRSLGFRDGLWRIEPRAEYGITTAFWEAYGRLLQFDADDRWTFERTHPLGPYQREFILGFRMSDGVWLWTDEEDSGAIAQPGAVAIDNEGSAPSNALVVTVTVPVQAPVTITNATTARTLRLGYAGPPAGTVIFDFAARTITDGVGGDLMSLFDPGSSTWWDFGVPALVPGPNVLNSTGTSDLRAEYRHAAY